MATFFPTRGMRGSQTRRCTGPASRTYNLNNTPLSIFCQVLEYKALTESVPRVGGVR